MLKAYFAVLVHKLSGVRDGLRRRNRLRWQEWMEYDEGKYGRYLSYYDEERLAFIRGGSLKI